MVVLTRNSVKTVPLFFFLVEKNCFQSACHMPQPWSHLTIICQDICWTKLTLNYSVWLSGTPQPVLSPPCHRSKGERHHEHGFDVISAWQSWQSRENHLQLFSRELGSSGCPKVDVDGRIPSWFVCRNFEKKEGIWGTEWTRRWKQWKCHEQDTASVCAEEEDEPQKLHNFLISSLPDTWLNSVVQWSTLTSTFCMICKTDFL